MIVNIVVANLLIGLTVSKTDELFKKAGIVRLQKTVNQIIAIDCAFGTELMQKCMPNLGRRLKIFSHLHSLFNKNVEKIPSPWKICVMPHSRRSTGRRVMHGNDASAVSFDKAYPVYLYNDVECTRKEKLKFTLPSWVILHTLNLLEQQKNNENAENVKEMAGQVTNMETFDELCDGHGQQVRKLEKRKVSVEPDLKKIIEEQFQENNDVVLQEFAKKLTSLQSDLEELKNLIHTATEKPKYRTVPIKVETSDGVKTQ